MIKLIGDPVRSGNAPLTEGSGAIYIGAAGGRFAPGVFDGELLEARERGVLRGATGLWFDHQAVVGVSAEARGAVAGLLQYLFKDRPVFVMDELSAEWAAHYGLSARVGGSVWWIVASRGQEGTVRDRAPDGTAKERFVSVCSTVAACFAAARDGYPMLILPRADGGPGCASQDSYSPVRRWAATYGMLDAFCNSEAEVAAKLAAATAFPRDRYEVESARARETLAELCAPPPPRIGVGAHVATFEPATEIEGGLAEALAAALGGPRVISSGDVFNPATHYDQNYYAGPNGRGIGRGIRYQRPDGSWTTYYGPARHWDGNRIIAQTLSRLLGTSGTLLDIGCGTGDFLDQMAALGWDARGVDISEDAARENPRVVCADFADPAGAVEQGYWDLVTALDFWEHIWSRDIDRLIDAARALLQPKGLHVAIICTRSAAEPDFVAEPGVRFTRENSWLLVSGHVHIRDWAWWARTFRRHGFRLRHDLAYLFQVKRNEDAGLSLVKSWQAKNLLVLEKA